jgi:tetraacyldisaccharide 4'-kinase
MRITHALHQRIEAMWWQKRKPAFPWRALSYAYKHISIWEQKKRLQHTHKPPLPLISIGNITVGGSGKTPFIIWLAEELRRHGWNPVILCRGDGGTNKAPVLLTSHALAHDVGDEAVLLHQTSHCPVIAAKNRVEACDMATHLGDIILLDDGFQYRQLERDCDIVLIPSEGIGNGEMIPAGPLREGITALQRADIIVRTGKASPSPLTQQHEWHWHTSALPLCDWMHCDIPSPQKVVAITAIARPKRFIDSLTSLDIIIEDSLFFPDHYAFSNHDIQHFMQYQQPIAVTAKDAVKLKDLWPKDKPLWVLEQTYNAEDGLMQSILNTLLVGKHNKQC